MNILFIMSDSVRWDFLGYNGCEWIRTPNLDQLASRSCVFNNAYLSSYPTVPNRWDLLTGRLNFTYAGWQPLDPQEVVVPERLREVGYLSMLIADTPHILAKGFNYQRGFDGWEWIRGQENDAWKTAPREVRYPCAPEKIRGGANGLVHYLRNISDRRGEADHFCARTIQAACDWLDANKDEGPFFLYLDLFDPHEPWDPPEPYVKLYDPADVDEQVTYPQYHPAAFFTEDEIRRMRALYAGELTMVDAWIGRLLEKLAALGLDRDTAVFFTSDHGFLHGEHGVVGKSIIDTSTGRLYYEAVPMFDLLARTPLLIHWPGQTERRDYDGFVQAIDLPATIVDACGADAQGLDGVSLVPTIRGDAPPQRGLAVSAYPLKFRTPRNCKSMIRDERWALLYSGRVLDPERELTPPDLPCGDGPDDYQIGDHRARLYDMQADPDQKHNVIDEHLDVAERLHAQYVSLLREMNTPAEYLESHETFSVTP